MKAIAMIPARYASTRFPAKLMQDLDGKSVILRTYENTVATRLFEEVFVVTDSDIIFNEILSHGGKVIMSIKEHECGSDRIAEAVENIDADIVVNVQGDEPFTSREPLKQLLNVFANDPEGNVDLASLMYHIVLEDDILNSNHVKVVTDRDGLAMYFSRSPIPYPRDIEADFKYFKHIGIYAFRKQALLDFASWEITPNEAAEKIEAIRYLEYGKKIKMIQTNEMPVGIDTPEDLEKARKKIREN